MLTQLGLSLRIMVSTQDFGSCGGSSILPGTTKLLIYEERRFIPLACITFFLYYGRLSHNKRRRSQRTSKTYSRIY